MSATHHLNSSYTIYRLLSTTSALLLATSGNFFSFGSLLLQSVASAIGLLSGSSSCASRELSFVQQALLDLTSHCGKAVFNANVALSWCLKIGNTIMLRKFLSFFTAYFSLIGQVAFVSYEDFADIIIGKLFNFQHPLSDVFKCFPVCNIIYDNYTVGSSVVACCQCSESFLSGCVPYLQFDILIVHFYCLNFEVYTDCVEKVIVERVFLYG